MSSRESPSFSMSTDDTTSISTPTPTMRNRSRGTPNDMQKMADDPTVTFLGPGEFFEIIDNTTTPKEKKKTTKIDCSFHFQCPQILKDLIKVIRAVIEYVSCFVCTVDVYEADDEEEEPANNNNNNGGGGGYANQYLRLIAENNGYLLYPGPVDDPEPIQTQPPVIHVHME